VPNSLPVNHPEYHYPSSKNPYWQKVRELSPLAFANNDTETKAGQWKAPHKELHVEIGCNGGHVLLEMAARNTNAMFIGIDWKFKQIHRGAEKAATRGINNITLLRAYAERIQYIFAPNEIDHLYLFFPDPWAKKAQLKHRFVTPENLELLAKLVRPGGTFEIKTDHAGYFEWMEEAVKNAPSWNVAERSTDLHAGHPAPRTLDFPDVTLFEKIFIREGIKINRLKLTRHQGI
jgi:tRNA (guanine-N7-)-methyltransferase